MLSATIQEVSLGQESYFASISWYVIPRNHYNDVIMGTMASQITSPTIVYSTIYSGADKKKTIKAPRHWPLCREFTGDRWIPRTKGQ